MRVFFAVMLIWLFGAAAALAEQRLALVIGNDAYQNIEPLQKATADARAYAALLREKGFVVSDGYDKNFQEMQNLVADFVDRIQPGDTAVFVYSGHGWSDGDHNYLVGVDAPAAATQARLVRNTLPLKNGADGVLDDIERKGASLKVAIVDACRDNPFKASGGKSYGLSRGLRPAAIEGGSGKGTFVIYSAGEGQSALDRLGAADKDPNSVFSRALLPLLKADLPLNDAIKAAQEQVSKLAASIDHDQFPAYYDEVHGLACLSPVCKTAPSPAPASAALDPAFAALIDATTDPAALAKLIAGLPEGPAKERARARAAQLKGTLTAKVEPAPAPSPKGERRYRLPEGAKLVPQLEHSKPFDSVAFSPDGARLLSGSDDGIVRLWDAASGKLLRAFEGHGEGLISVAFAADGARVLSGSGDKTVKLWDAASGRLLRTFEGHVGPVYSVAFSPDAARVLSGSWDNTVRMWDAASGKMMRTFGGDGSPVESVVFSPDGARVLSGNSDYTVRLWDAASGRLLRTFAGHGNSVNSVAFSPDGARVLSGSFDKTVRLWDAASGKLLRTFAGHGGPVLSVAFSPDGARVLSGSWDKTVKLWDAASGQLFRTFEGHNIPVNSVAFSRDGARIVSGSGDGTVKLWTAASGVLLATFSTYDGAAFAYTPSGLFVGDADPRKAFKIMRGAEEFPLDEFVALNRRESLAEAMKEEVAGK